MTPKVFIGLSEVAGYFSNLEAGLRELGVDARFFNLSPHPLAYGGTGKGRLARLMTFAGAPRSSVRGLVWRTLLRANRLVRRLRSAFLFPFALARYDAFVLGGHETFLGGREFALMRRFGKTVVIVFTGSDHRPPYLSGVGIRDDPSSAALADATARVRRRVDRAERHASAVVALPESAQLHARPFVHFLAVGFPFAAREAATADPGGANDRAVRILHCPTDIAAKGTERVRAAVEACRARGAPIEYREVSGRPHAEVLEALEWTDFVVDQVHGDTPMAALATEAAYFGKPSVVGSYAAGVRLEVPGTETPPSLYCHPDALEDAVWTLVSDRAARHDLGRRAREFVRNEWAPASVAARMLRVIAGDVPDSWIARPEQLSYVLGYGISEPVLRARIRRLIADQGVDALGVPSGSPLRDALVALAGD